MLFILVPGLCLGTHAKRLCLCSGASEYSPVQTHRRQSLQDPHSHAGAWERENAQKKKPPSSIQKKGALTYSNAPSNNSALPKRRFRR